MNKFWIVLSHTYLTKVKSKSFIITTALFLVFILAIVNIESIINLFADSDENREDVVAVLDESDYLYDVLAESINQVDENVSLELFSGSVEEAEEAVVAGNYEGLLQLYLDENDLPIASYHTEQLTNTMLHAQLEVQLQQMKVAIATSQAGVDQAVLEEIYAPVHFDTVLIESGGSELTAKSEEEMAGAIGLVTVILVLLYIAVITYGSMIAVDIANEKSSRVMEVLISSSSPVSQMFAKIIGIALLGLTQFGVVILFGFTLIQLQSSDNGSLLEELGLTNVPVSTYLYAILFFLLGYLLYATMAAMLGSIVSRSEEVQQLMSPIIILIIIAYFIAIFGMGMPESTLVTVSSFIPFFAPMLMFLRVGMLEVPIWEVGLSIGLMIATIAILAIIGARVYRGGVLMYGTSTSLKDFKRALQLSKKE